MDCADHVLACAAVPQRLAGRFDPAGKCRVGYDPTVPDLLDNLVTTYNTIGIFKQQHDQAQNLRLHRNALSASMELEGRDIQRKVGENMNHGGGIAASGSYTTSLKSPRHIQASTAASDYKSSSADPASRRQVSCR